MKAEYKVKDSYSDNIYLACEDHMNQATNCNTSSDYFVEELDYEADCDYCGVSINENT